MKNLFIPIIAAALFIVAVGIFLQKSDILVPTATPAPISTVTIDSQVINVELAISSDQKAKGLSGRKSLDAGGGMLFIFTNENKAQSFWMKDMLIPLDLIWIQGGKIIRIDKNVPAPATSTLDSKLKIYSAGVPVDFVLEVNSGFSDTNGVKVGDTITTTGV